MLLGVGSSTCIFINSSGDFEAQVSLRTTALDYCPSFLVGALNSNSLLLQFILNVINLPS